MLFLLKEEAEKNGISDGEFIRDKIPMTKEEVFGGILGISAVVSLMVLAGQLFGGLPFFSRFLDQSMILFCPLAALLFFAVREAVKAGNRVFTLPLTGLGMTACLLAVLYIGSLWNGGFYANQIAAVFDGLCRGFTASFFYWCAMILFTLSAILALYQIIRRIVGMRADLVLQTEHARQLDSQLSVQKELYETRLSHEKEIRSLCLILNNALENALTASLTMPEGDRVIKAMVFLISDRQPCAGTVIWNAAWKAGILCWM